MKERWWLDADRRDVLARVGALDVSIWMGMAGAGTVFSSDRQSAVARVDGEVPLLVKWRRPIPGRRRRTLLRASRERREARAMLRARALGIPCPEPWAVGERRRWGSLAGAVLVRPYAVGAVTGAQAIAGDSGAHAQLAEALRQWHDLGFRHGDCYPKNVLIGGEAEVPRPIGCPAARFVQSGRRVDRARLKDLAQWAVGTGDSLDFIDTYAGPEGFGPPAALKEAVRPFIGRIMAKKAERLATRPQREPDGPPQPVPLDVGEAPRVQIRDMENLV